MITALLCSEPLRFKVGGPKRSSPWLCGMGPPEECGSIHEDNRGANKKKSPKDMIP